jgi:hypothetical protein
LKNQRTILLVHFGNGSEACVNKEHDVDNAWHGIGIGILDMGVHFHPGPIGVLGAICRKRLETFPAGIRLYGKRQEYDSGVEERNGGRCGSPRDSVWMTCPAEVQG